MAETVYVAVETNLNAEFGFAFQVAPPLASEVNTLFNPAPVGMVTVLLKVAAPVVVSDVNVAVPDAVNDVSVVAPTTLTVDENVAAPACADVEDNVVAPLADNVVKAPVLAVVEPIGVF